MTARPPEPLHDDALSAEERELAARLAKLDASAGPSAALDARILAAARASVPASPVRRARRWPQALGAAAVLVAAVGLAWQLKPMFALPPPPVAAAGPGGNGASDVVVQVESVPRPAAAAAAAAPSEAGDVAVASAAAEAATSRRAGVTDARVAPAPQRAAKAARATHPGEFVDEAVPPPAAPVAAAAPAPEARENALNLDRVEAAGSRMKASADASARAGAAAADARLPEDIGADARLPLADWFARIRARRDAGDIDGARASLARLVAARPHVHVPRDLQPLLHDEDPWSR